jgi:hypothetical protein
MKTNEKEALLDQFCAVVPGIARETALFFLDANNWVLQVEMLISISRVRTQ